MITTLVRLGVYGALVWMVAKGWISKEQADSWLPDLVNAGVLILGFAFTVGWSYFQKIHNGWIDKNGEAVKNFNQAFKNGILILALLFIPALMSGCQALPFILASAPSLIQAVAPLITVQAKQTALNAAHKINTGYPVDDAKLAKVLSTEGLPPLIIAQSHALVAGLTAALTAIQAQTPGGPPAVQASVSQAIVAAQKELVP